MTKRKQAEPEAWRTGRTAVACADFVPGTETHRGVMLQGQTSQVTESGVAGEGRAG
jgi:hypothetical protein